MDGSEIRRSGNDATELRGYDKEQSGFDLRSEGAMTRNLLDENFDRDFYLQGSIVIFFRCINGVAIAIACLLACLQSYNKY